MYEATIYGAVTGWIFLKSLGISSSFHKSAVVSYVFDILKNVCDNF